MSDDFSALLAGEVEDAWPRCLEVWRKRGRVEDLPKGKRHTKYSADEGKRLGVAFAEKFPASVQFVTGKLSSADPVEAACAYDMTEFIAKVWLWRRREAGLYLADLTSLTTPIPAPFLEQIRSDWIYDGFKGSTIGEYIAYIDRIKEY